MPIDTLTKFRPGSATQIKRFLSGAKKNPRLLMERLHIKTKNKRIVPLKFNLVQELLYKKFMESWSQNRPVRWLVLKARQEGVSTFIEALYYALTTLHPITDSLIVADEADKSSHLFEMNKRFYDSLPPFLQPARQYSNRKELVFKDKDNPGLSLNSSITINTAVNLDAGRSQTFHNFHGSEVAYWPNAKKLLDGVEQSVPELPGTCIIHESTANGVGDYWYELWNMAKEGEIDYEPIFLAWHMHDEYMRPLENGEMVEPIDGDAEEEKSLIERFQLTPEQVNWRRYTIRNKLKGDVEMFRQEYPADDVEAFLVSGLPVFPRATLRRYLSSAQQRTYRQGYMNGLKFLESEGGPLRVWKEPEEGKHYVLAVDVAEGLEHGDYSCVEVLCREDLEQVAEWHAHIDPIEFAAEIAKLATWYNKGLVAPEVNNHGIATLNELKHFYSSIYRWQTFDSFGVRETTKLGWETNIRTKPLIIDLMVNALSQDVIKLNSVELIKEMMTFVRTESGAEGQSGCFDDRVMAMMIALQVHRVTGGWNGPSEMRMSEESVPAALMLQRLMREHRSQQKQYV